MNPAFLENFLPRVSSHFFSMHGWQRKVLWLAMLLFGGGVAGQTTTFFGHTNEQTVATNAAPAEVKKSDPTMMESLSPVALKVGASLLGGFLLGFALRIFVKITMTLLTFGALAMMLMSYFNIKNIDLTEAKTKYDNSVHWAEDQAYKLKDVAQSHLPSGGTGAFGAFAGFRRKKPEE